VKSYHIEKLSGEREVHKRKEKNPQTMKEKKELKV